MGTGGQRVAQEVDCLIRKLCFDPNQSTSRLPPLVPNPTSQKGGHPVTLDGAPAPNRNWVM
jgi:hypothetical protein